MDGIFRIKKLLALFLFLVFKSKWKFLLVTTTWMKKNCVYVWSILNGLTGPFNVLKRKILN